MSHAAGRRGNHWLAIRRFGEHYLDLDSLLAAPKPFASADDLRGFLHGILEDEGHVLFLNRASAGAGEATVALAGGEEPSEVFASDNVVKAPSPEA